MTYTDIFGIDWQDDELVDAVVCTTHMRHVPCRRDGEHRFSDAVEDVRAVVEWQRS